MEMNLIMNQSTTTTTYSNVITMSTMVSNESCNSNQIRLNSTIIPTVFNGIPANLVINLVGFFILVMFFGVLRKKAWNYGRLALLHKTDNNRWMELFYGEHDDVETPVIPSGESSVNAKLSRIDNGYFSWITTAFKITDRELLSRAGPDGLLYISFQRHLIILTSMMLFVSLFIALPINYSGNLQGVNSTFGHTTMSNLDPQSHWMWVHTIIILSYLPIGVFLMKRYIKQVREARPAGEVAARTLLISNIPKEYCNIDNLKLYFSEAFPTLKVEDITLAHDIQRLSELDIKRDCAEQARLYCENYNTRRESSLKLYPHIFGQIIGCCCPNKIDALEFYKQEELRLTALFDEEKKVALSKPLGIAFVTLNTNDSARALRRQLRSSTSNSWVVEQAPAPSDILWENLNVPKPCWYFNALLINISLVIFLFFVTTPIVIVSAIENYKIIPQFQNFPYIISFLPALLAVSIAALMPVLVGKTESLVSHWTKSGLNRSIMKKTLTFLLFMVLILPSLGLTTAGKIFQMELANQLKCVFLADKGAFFVNYIITAALLGSAMELMRFPELALYTIRLCLARSKAERVHVRKAVIWDFPLGAHYAWLLLVFTMTTVYSVACPLITPFGLLYLSVKHVVDRHNLCFAYGPSVGGGQLAETATKALGVAPILTQLAFLSLGLVRRELSAPLAGVQLIGLTTSLLGLVTGIILPASKPKEQIPKRDLSAGHFVPPVLRKTYPSVTTEEITSSNNNTDTTTTPESNDSPQAHDNPALYQNYNLNIC